MMFLDPLAHLIIHIVEDFSTLPTIHERQERIAIVPPANRGHGLGVIRTQRSSNLGSVRRREDVRDSGICIRQPICAELG
jgi:hypothetical protein